MIKTNQYLEHYHEGRNRQELESKSIHPQFDSTPGDSATLRKERLGDLLNFAPTGSVPHQQKTPEKRRFWPLIQGRRVIGDSRAKNMRIIGAFIH